MTMTLNKHNYSWNDIIADYHLSEHQLWQFNTYQQFLIEKNNDFNLTAITDPEEIQKFHFVDSLSIASFVDFNRIQSIADIGTGAGFPAIPLKIVFPHLRVYLLEVNKKKINFLQELARLLNLSDIVTCDYDWRTFLRKTTYPIDLFVSRASLHPDELLRVFKKSSPYKHTQLVYWASQNWLPQEDEKKHLARKEIYSVGNKTRQLIFFKNYIE
ncbi:MAG: 16S rRNA (guanine(527)-N(7))-methyltransferase RsmG [Candidatus Dependentiae bacterium]